MIKDFEIILDFLGEPKRILISKRGGQESQRSRREDGSRSQSDMIGPLKMEGRPHTEECGRSWKRKQILP